MKSQPIARGTVFEILQCVRKLAKREPVSYGGWVFMHGFLPSCSTLIPITDEFWPRSVRKETLSYLILHLVTIFYHKNRKNSSDNTYMISMNGNKVRYFLHIFSHFCQYIIVISFPRVSGYLPFATLYWK